MDTGQRPTNNLSSEARSKGGRNSPGNFKNNPQRAAEAGRKGGRVSGGNFKNDPKRAAEAGRKGGAAITKNKGAMSPVTTETLQ